MARQRGGEGLRHAGRRPGLARAQRRRQQVSQRLHPAPRPPAARRPAQPPGGRRRPLRLHFADPHSPWTSAAATRHINGLLREARPKHRPQHHHSRPAPGHRRRTQRPPPQTLRLPHPPRADSLNSSQTTNALRRPLNAPPINPQARINHRNGTEATDVRVAAPSPRLMAPRSRRRGAGDTHPSGARDAHERGSLAGPPAVWGWRGCGAWSGEPGWGCGTSSGLGEPGGGGTGPPGCSRRGG